MNRTAPPRRPSDPADEGSPPPRTRRSGRRPVLVRPTEPRDFAGIREMCALVYPGVPPYDDEVLGAQLRAFPEGQLVAVDPVDQRVLGSASSLIVRWEDYEFDMSWRDFTEHGTFANHDPTGRTLYGAEVMVRPDTQGRGVGKALYAARRELTRRLGLRRIRAGGRLRGYHRHAAAMSAEDYVIKVIARELGDPTLTFQLRQGFRVLAVVEGYLRHDPESLGYAAVIEWINHEAAQRSDYRRRSAKFAKHRKRPAGDDR